jgi:hypothetical protein
MNYEKIRQRVSKKYAESDKEPCSNASIVVGGSMKVKNGPNRINRRIGSFTRKNNLVTLSV